MAQPDYRNQIAQSLADGLSWGVEVIAGDAGGVRLHEVFGEADGETSRRLTPDLLYDLASVTKVAATAMACAVCYDRGLLDPAAPLRAYLPLHHAGGAVALRELATHTSGYDNSKPYHAGWPAGEAFDQAVLATEPARAPGQAFEYSCVNYILLGLVVEAVTGERLDRFCERAVYAPLGMAATRFGPLSEPAERLVRMPTVPAGVISDEGARAAGRPIGNAGLFATASDLARWAMMLLRGGAPLLSPRAVALLTQRATPEHLRPRSFGWDMGDDLRPAGWSPATIYHTGWTGQTVAIDPARGVFAVVLTNRTGDHERAREVRRDIAAAVAQAVVPSG